LSTTNTEIATRKHSEFLNVEDSEDYGGQGYNSEAEDLRKGGRSVKRRKAMVRSKNSATSR
jgi:ESF2/ABP1 family protein